LVSLFKGSGDSGCFSYVIEAVTPMQMVQPRRSAICLIIVPLCRQSIRETVRNPKKSPSPRMGTTHQCWHFKNYWHLVMPAFSDSHSPVGSHHPDADYSMPSEKKRNIQAYKTRKSLYQVQHPHHLASYKKSRA